MSTITIETLAKLCLKEIQNGNGKKKIIISGDDEGNSYHELFFGFTPTIDNEGKNFFKESYTSPPFGVNEKNINKYVILG